MQATSGSGTHRFLRTRSNEPKTSNKIYSVLGRRPTSISTKWFITLNEVILVKYQTLIVLFMNITQYLRFKTAALLLYNPSFGG
jgi:hypothetical protein